MTAASSAAPRSDSGDEEHECCMAAVGSALEYCPRVAQLRQALQKLGRDVPVSCMRCPDPEAGKTAAAGGFMPDTGTIVMCQQWAAEQPGEVPNTVAHEMIHAYDDARARLDWTNLLHHACTEIRAANLSGDCSFWREVNRANISPLRVAKAGERCVRRRAHQLRRRQHRATPLTLQRVSRRAQISVAMNPACTSERAAEAAVDQAMRHCFADTAPFERVP